MAVAQIIVVVLFMIYFWKSEIVPLVQEMQPPDGFNPMHPAFRVFQYVVWGWFSWVILIEVAVNSVGMWHNILSRPNGKLYARKYGRYVANHPECPDALKRLYFVFCGMKSMLAGFLLFFLINTVGFLYWHGDLAIYLFDFLKSEGLGKARV